MEFSLNRKLFSWSNLLALRIPTKKDWVWRLQKSLYWMKQANSIWNITFHKTMTSLGFRRLVNEWCVYRRSTSTGTTIFAVHVDNIIAVSSSPAKNDAFKAELRQHWDISDLGAANFALGISIARDLSPPRLTRHYDSWWIRGKLSP